MCRFRELQNIGRDTTMMLVKTCRKRYEKSIMKYMNNSAPSYVIEVTKKLLKSLLKFIRDLM